MRCSSLASTWLAALTLSLPIVSPALAQTPPWPSKPLKLIVPFPPGGTSDYMGRLVAEKLAAALKQPVTVENIAGGGGVTGTLKALAEPADGYTLIQSGIGQNAVAHGMDAKVGYDSIKDFTHLTQVHSGANVLVASPKAPFKTLGEMIAYGKANPGKLSYGFTHASSGHVAMELLKQSLNVCLVNAQGSRDCKGLAIAGVPYKGGGPLATALVEGQVPMAFINQDAAYPLVKDGKLQALAVTSTTRNSLFPNVPTLSEKELPGFTALSWSGISVSSKTPAPIAAKLESELVKIMRSPDMRQQLEAKGFVVPDQGSETYSRFIEREIGRWGRVIRIAGIKPE